MVKSRALLYPLEWAWLLLGFSTVTIAHRTAAEALSGTVDDTNLQRFGFVLIALTIILLHLNRVPRFRLNPISLFLLYVMFGTASSLWSTSFIASLGKSVELMAATLVVWVTMVGPDKETRLQRLITLTIAEACL